MKHRLFLSVAVCVLLMFASAFKANAQNQIPVMVPQYLSILSNQEYRVNEEGGIITVMFDARGYITGHADQDVNSLNNYFQNECDGAFEVLSVNYDTESYVVTLNVRPSHEGQRVFTLHSPSSIGGGYIRIYQGMENI